MIRKNVTRRSAGEVLVEGNARRSVGRVLTAVAAAGALLVLGTAARAGADTPADGLGSRRCPALDAIARQLPPGHPPVDVLPLPPGHPPVDAGASRAPTQRLPTWVPPAGVGSSIGAPSFPPEMLTET